MTSTLRNKVKGAKKRKPVLSREALDALRQWRALDIMERGMAIDSLVGTDDDLMPDTVYCVLDGLLRSLEPRT